MSKTGSCSSSPPGAQASQTLDFFGTFVQYRKSLLNWCPIGRNANNQQRKDFIEFDSKSNFRLTMSSKLKTKINLLCPGKVTVKLGGDTSFDIYPTGWDKTYALRHFEDRTCWFVGDRCGIDGNDYEIYQKCLGQSYVSEGPEHTKEIIDCITEHFKDDTKTIEDFIEILFYIPSLLKFKFLHAFLMAKISACAVGSFFSIDEFDAELITSPFLSNITQPTGISFLFADSFAIFNANFI